MNPAAFQEDTAPFKKPPLISRNEKKISRARDLLLSRIFMGCYEERKYVAQLMEYRDVVKIPPAESELRTDLHAVSKVLQGSSGIKWSGITVPEVECSKPGSYCLWVKFTNLPFGSFWFQIEQILCENEEIIWMLRCLRPVRLQDYNVPKALLPQPENSKNSEDSAENSFPFNPVLKIAALYATLNECICQVRRHLTWNNTVLVSKFIVATVFVLISGAFTLIRYTGEYLITLIREVTLLLRVATPILIHAMDCFTKIIGGIFVLIALIFRGGRTQVLENEFHSQNKTGFHRQRPLPMLMSAHHAQVSSLAVNNQADEQIRNKEIRT